MNSLQDRMSARLANSGIPAKEIRCYGSQVMITCLSLNAADRFYGLLHKFCRKVRSPLETIDYNEKNLNTVLRPTMHKVWRVWGTI